MSHSLRYRCDKVRVGGIYCITILCYLFAMDFVSILTSSRLVIVSQYYTGLVPATIDRRVLYLELSISPPNPQGNDEDSLERAKRIGLRG